CASPPSRSTSPCACSTRSWPAAGKEPPSPAPEPRQRRLSARRAREGHRAPPRRGFFVRLTRQRGSPHSRSKTRLRDSQRARSCKLSDSEGKFVRVAGTGCKRELTLCGVSDA